MEKFCEGNWHDDMKSAMLEDSLNLASAYSIQQGEGSPVILIHGAAASVHDWDDLIPELTKNNHTSYALDLLGHGGSPKPNSRTYQMSWMYDHFSNWMQSLRLTEPAVLIGHSMGGYLALEYARRVPAWTRGLILVNPLYSRLQLPFFLRSEFATTLSGAIAWYTPERLFRFFVDIGSRATGHGIGGSHSLPEHVRAQTTFDYKRTAPGIYNAPHTMDDLTDRASTITTPTLLVWGDRDPTLSPSSFPKLLNAMPRASGKAFRAGHVPHQSNIDEFNQVVIEFLRGLE